MECIQDYCVDAGMRETLYPLFELVFGIPSETFSDFHKRGFWDPTYHPYTFFQDGTAIANVSRFVQPLIVAGKPVAVCGIQSVMTHPDYRGQGLMRRLFEMMLRDIDAGFETSLLFTENPNLFSKFGFQNVPEFYFVSSYRHRERRAEKGVRKLNVFEPSDTRLINELLQIRTPPSEHFFPLYYAPSFYLNLYDPLAQERVYYAKELHAVLIFAVNNDTLELYDVIAPTLPKLEDICALIPVPFAKIALYFSPDRFANVSWTAFPDRSTSHLMVRGRMDAHSDFKYPETAKF
ncbi:MAG: GNAT family N-acetyltransferase [Bacilli bacterium]